MWCSFDIVRRAVFIFVERRGGLGFGDVSEFFRVYRELGGWYCFRYFFFFMTIVVFKFLRGREIDFFGGFLGLRDDREFSSRVYTE